MSEIHLNDRGEAVRVHQGHLNDRLTRHGDDPIAVDGDCGPMTIEATALAAWFLGAMESTVKAVRDGTISVGVQGIVADPGSRNPEQLQRARDRRKPKFTIVSCGDWGALPPRGTITRVGRPTKIVFHHTAGNCPDLDHVPGDSLDEAKAYARQIQRDHMSRDWIDSGHNFLVTRSGHILEGRHGSLAAIQDGAMVSSAHCPGANSQPGIEHEHVDGQSMTAEQREASLFLHELICRATGIAPEEIYGHGSLHPTACPGSLKGGLDQFRKDLKARMQA